MHQKSYRRKSGGGNIWVFLVLSTEKKLLRCTVDSVGSFSAFNLKVLKSAHYFASFDTLQVSLKMNY